MSTALSSEQDATTLLGAALFGAHATSRTQSPCLLSSVSHAHPPGPCKTAHGLGMYTASGRGRGAGGGADLSDWALSGGADLRPDANGVVAGAGDELGAVALRGLHGSP